MESTIYKIWAGSKLMIKALVIGTIILILQIPRFYIEDLIKERQQRQNEARNEISSKWAGRQNIAGPVIVIPYWQLDEPSKKHYASFLPDDLQISADVLPKEKYRGIYKAMLYTAKISFSASFYGIKPEKLLPDSINILWNEAFVKINLLDIKGLNEELHIKFNNTELILSPQASELKNSADQLIALLHITNAEDLKNVHLSGNINLNGSDALLFTPLGRSTIVNLHSNWPDPSFTGNSLPQTSIINKKGFNATWKNLSFKRNFPQEWKDDSYYVSNNISFAPENLSPGEAGAINNSAFGTNLFIPVSAYQETQRSVKYAALCMLLTFAAFFIIETTNKKSIHPFQYGLIGISLILFYTLLLSFSEYIGFNFSYLISSVSTIALIAWFLNGILASSKLSLLLSLVLALIYSYIFILLQLQDYSLLLGSIGLFLTLALIMHFSKKMQWVNKNINAQIKTQI